MKSREALLLEQEHAAPELSQARRAGRPGGTPTDDDDLRLHRAGYSAGFGGGPSWMRSPMYAPISVNKMPIAAMMT